MRGIPRALRPAGGASALSTHLPFLTPPGPALQCWVPPPGSHMSHQEEAWSHGTPSLSWGPPNVHLCLWEPDSLKTPPTARYHGKRTPVPALSLPSHAVTPTQAAGGQAG